MPAMGIEIYIREPLGEGRISYAEPITMSEPLDDSRFIQPAFTITKESAEQLMEDLWNAGIRPAATKPQGETIAALKDHLEDSKAVAHQLLNYVLSGD
jgi:hypothetical protein